MADKKRKHNWSDKECEILTERCVTNMKIVMGKFSNSLKSSSKKEFWQDTCEIINACGGSNRTVPEIMKKWADMKSKAKQAEQKRRVHMRKTGGGNAPASLSALEEKIISIFPKEVLEGVGFGEDTFIAESDCSCQVSSPDDMLNVSQHREESVTVHSQIEEDKENSEPVVELGLPMPTVHKRSKSQADECIELISVERDILEESRKRNIILREISGKMDEIIKLKKKKIEILEKQNSLQSAAALHDMFFET